MRETHCDCCSGAFHQRAAARRRAFTAGLAAGVFGAAARASAPAHASAGAVATTTLTPELTPDRALRRMQAGNEAFRNGVPLRATRMGASAWRSSLGGRRRSAC